MNVIAEARERGELEKRVIGDQRVHGWTRGDDRWQCLLERRLTLSCMDDRLKRTAVFE